MCGSGGFGGGGEQRRRRTVEVDAAYLAELERRLARYECGAVDITPHAVVVSGEAGQAVVKVPADGDL